MIKTEEFEDTLEEVVIIVNEQRTSNNINKEIPSANFCNKPLVLQGLPQGPLG